MNDIIAKADQTATELGKLYNEFRDCNSDRSMVQLRHFVVGKNETTGRQWLQVMTELRIAWNELRRMMLDRKEQHEKARAVDCHGNPTVSEIDRDRALLRIEVIEYDMDAKVKECGKLLQLRDELKEAHGGKGWTDKEIEDEEKAYYTERLRHQAVLDMANRGTGIGVGNLQSLEQLGVLKLDVQDNKVFIVENLGLFPKRLTDKAEGAP